MKIGPQLGSHRKVRLVYEFFLAAAISWTLVWLDRPRQQPILPGVDRHLFLRHLYERLALVEPSTVVFQVFWTVLIATCLFVLFRLISFTRLGVVAIANLGGIFAVIAFPILFWNYPKLGITPERISANSRVLFAEMIVAGIGLAVFYLKRPREIRTILVLCVVHFAIWTWATGFYVSLASQLAVYEIWQARFWVSTLFYLGFPTLNTGCALLWLFLRSSQNGIDSAVPQAQGTGPK
jgi:hypothetical protein